VTGKTSKSEARREEILVGAAACFSEKGLRGASIGDICARLGISPGHLYYYFKNKEAIVLALLDRVRARSIAEIERTAEDTDSLDDILSGRFLAKASARQHGLIDDATMWEVYAEAVRTPAIAAKNQQHWRENSAALRALLAREQARGRIRADADLDLVLTLLAMFVTTTQLAEFADPDFDPAHYRKVGMTMFRPFLAEPPAISKPGRRRA
jgi:AcrR family transcriptional regulator